MNKKKLGIITFHTANNFGAALQSFAMKRVCEHLGYEVFFVRYIGFDVSEQNSLIHNFLSEPNKKRGTLTLVRQLMSYLGDKKRKEEFVRFRKTYMDETILCHTGKEIAELGFDAYVAGSDQIWNYRITGNKVDPVFFLNFPGESQKVVYAASSQDVPFPLKEENELKKQLHETKAAIGIRESSLASYCSNLTGIEYPVVLDPTLLAGYKIISELTTKKISKEPYILIYQIDSNPNSDISVRSIEKRFGKKCYILTVPRIGSMHGRKGDIGPEEFLSYLKNAEFLVTNSFHGVALSLLFEQQFYVYENGGVMSRIDDLLSLVGLDDRKVCMTKDIDLSKQIDFKSVKERLATAQKFSMDYLCAALEGKYVHNIAVSKPVEKTKEKLLFSQREKRDCCGCTACAEICPVHAISMEKDDEGFLYPVRCGDKCIHCGLCDSVCGFELEKSSNKQLAYGVKNKNDQQREASRSGAAFMAFAELILRQHGTVYGAVMEADFSVKHIRIEAEKDLSRMQKAKYVQSDLQGIYPLVEQDLLQQRSVLFSGTPCQISGLKHYIREKHISDEKLYTCDLICHGVPSPKIWSKYLEYIKQKYHRKIVDAQFRDKEFGWDSHCESFMLEGKKKKVVTREYTELFYQHIMFRPSCANCQFANVNRIGDVTLGDFWGIEKHDSSFNDNRGVSLIFVNTKKGKQIFDEVKEGLIYFECNPQNCLQPTLQRPSKESPKREDFWKDCEMLSFEKLLSKYAIPSEKSARLKYKIKKYLYKLGLRKHP